MNVSDRDSQVEHQTEYLDQELEIITPKITGYISMTSEFTSLAKM
jgi:hypothetical protein